MCPDIRTGRLGYTERPASTVDIATVLPDRTEALLEEIDGFAHLDLFDGGVVVVAPEILDGFDLGAELFEARSILLAFGGFLLFVGLPVFSPAHGQPC